MHCAVEVETRDQVESLNTNALLVIAGIWLPHLRIFLALIYVSVVVVRNVEYSILLVMSELSTVRCDRALGLWLQVHGHQVSTESCCGGAVADGPCGGRR